MASKYSRKGNPQAQMALREHLREFRNRVIKAAIATVLAAVAGFFFYYPVMRAITAPIADIAQDHGRHASINFNGVASAFDVMVQVSLAIGLVLASPVWLYQLWAYITPALHKKEKLYAVSFVCVSVPLFLLGIWIAWLCMPTAVKTLTAFTPDGQSNFIEAKTYISFVVKLIISFGISFVIPVALVGVNMMGLIRGRTILKSWRWVVVVVALLAAMTAPGTDVMTMFYLMAPLLILFFLAIAICMFNDKRRDKKNAKLVESYGVDSHQTTDEEGLEQIGR
ncbi:twin-arginine translocase subunit TatC [Kocuria koreensis]|jgi:sec-independent protein translocase protein TatC|uniref:Sec-independent protein translocase protein TatC n=1 Tax=Rothia koreensis TaxID=592378 RepID=A0A7K1LHB0_9MICC|nr:twin-arginine translocase subunit TatC [Rothia koreensis]MUN54332.1 twin-arginine translocase subunit TatC [Rothia koreensis]